jgi:Flp pilus assembly pilin Flp
MYRFPKREVLGYRHIRSSLLALLNKYQAPSGQGMTEYIVVVAVVAVAAIGVYSMLGQTIRNQTAGIAQEISGNDAGAALNAATSSALAARSQANVRKDLKNYNQDNH